MTLDTIVAFYQKCYEYTGPIEISKDRNPDFSASMHGVGQESPETGSVVLKGRFITCPWDEVKIIVTCALFVLSLVACVWRCRCRPALPKMVEKVD